MLTTNARHSSLLTLVLPFALACAAPACSSRGASDGSNDANDAAASNDARVDATSPAGDGGSGGDDRPDASPVASADASTDASIVLDPNAVDPATKAILRAGGNDDPSLRWLYPYDATVFPRGLVAPSMQWAGAPADAYYVQITTNALRVEAFYGAGPMAIALDASTWSAITLAGGAVDVAITIARGGKATGPRHEAWTIAPASLPGVLYYAALGSPQLNGNGAVMKLPFGSPASIVVGQTTCMGCHGVSADGTTMIASYGDNQTGAIFDLKTGATHLRDQPDSAFTWGALYPDGSVMMSNGALAGGYPPNVSGQEQGPRPSRLYDPRTGAIIPSADWDSRITAALMPSFAPDGKKIAFNHYDAGQGKSLSVMDFDITTRTFSNFVDIAIDDTRFLGWPTFLPGDQYVVFQAGSREDYVTEQGGKGDLAITSSGGQAIVSLDALNGVANGSTYLPYGDAEAHLSYWPSVAPDVAGGYAWVAFTSRREYGNTITNASQDDDARQKIWIAAIDVAPLPGKDPSHPAFFIDGQEMASGNMRPVWTR